MRLLAPLLVIVILILAALGGYYLYSYYQSSEVKNQVNAPSESTWSFLVVGDTEGVNQATAQFLTEANQSQAQFIVHLGDFVKAGQAEEFTQVQDQFLNALTKKYYPVLGNNDLGSVLDYQYDNYKKYITAELYYSFDYNTAHFIILDNANRYLGFSDEQLDWLAQDLEHNQQPFTFIFFHRPFQLPLEQFTSADETSVSKKSNKRFREIIAPYKIDQIFTGHLHTYLTYDLDAVPVTISGGGGATPQNILGGEASAFYHYLEVVVSPDDFSINIKRL